MTKSKFQKIAAEPPYWINQSWDEDDIFVCSEVKVSRNIDGFPFPWAADSDDKKRVKDLVAELMKDFNFDSCDLASIGMAERLMLRERRIISHSLVSAPPFSTAFWNNGGGSQSICTNEVDHIRMRFIRHGNDLVKAIDDARDMKAAMATVITFSHDENHGFLTSHYQECGSGTRLSVLLHLPGIILSNSGRYITMKLVAAGIHVGGAFGAGTEGTGNIFHLYVEPKDDDKLYSEAKRLIDLAEEIAAIEKEKRSVIINDIDAVNAMSMSWGVLKYANVIEAEVAMNNLSCSIAAMKAGMGKFDVDVLKDLVYEVMPGHLEMNNYDGDGEKCEALVRAELLRQKIRGTRKLVLT